MELYRGMSILEWKTWIENERIIPQDKNFTPSGEEAINLGKCYTSPEDLIILKVRYEDDLFKPLHNTNPGYNGNSWYQNSRKLSIDELLFEILCPCEIMKQKNQKSLY